MAQNSISIREFLKSRFDEGKLAKLDSAAGLWFTAYQTASLALAIFQVENFAVQMNVGLLNFLVSGVMFFLFELTKHRELIDFRISIYVCLRWYTFMLFSALAATSCFYVTYVIVLAHLGSLDLVQMGSMLLFYMIVSLLVFLKAAKWADHSFNSGLRGMLKNRDESIAVQVATKFAPSGISVPVVLFTFNTAVFLATLNGDPFDVAFVPQVVNEWVIWLLVVVLLIPALYKTYNDTRLEQLKLMPKEAH